MEKIFAGILSVIIAAAFVLLYVSNQQEDNENHGTASKTAYKDVNKTYAGFIFSGEGQLIKETPFKLKGKQFSETLTDRDCFSGTIEIEGESTDISSTRDKTAFFSDIDAEKFFLAANPDPNNSDEGMVKYEASIAISKDFTIAYGYTPYLKEKYGEGVFFKSDKDYKTLSDDYIQYRQEAAKRVKTFFKFDQEGRLLGTINGTVLSINLEEFRDDQAVIEATSWFGNLGAVFPKYKAVYKDGKWQLELLKMAVS